MADFKASVSRYLEKHGYPRIRLKAVLFDMDGVLFNSMPYHADAWNKVMARYGLHLSREEAFLHEGRTGSSTINIVYRRQFGKPACQLHTVVPPFFLSRFCASRTLR